MKNFIQILRDRGMLHSLMPGVEDQFTKEVTKAYIGFDPTASSLHVGNLATIMLLKQLQLAGHRPVMVLGGATGMVGDPSFKASERPLLNKETLVAHQKALKKQMEQFLDFSPKYGALFVNNYDWLQEMDFLSFLREVGKHISINYMMAKESVKGRLSSGISYTEFAYPLLQAYDFYHLYTHHGVKVQMGGSDQWGNITTGTELIRKKSGGEAYGITTPLLVKADGTKFGKTASGSVWLDPTMTSPYTFYQFWLNSSDADVGTLIRRMTLVSIAEIEALEKTHAQAPHKRLLQKRLAKEVTTFVHGEAICLQVIEASEILFGAAPSDALANLNEALLLQSLAGVPQVTIAEEALERCDSLLHLLTEATDHQIFPSRRVAREVIQGGGIRINKQKHADPTILPALPWLHRKYLLIQKGKKNFYLIKRNA